MVKKIMSNDSTIRTLVRSVVNDNTDPGTDNVFADEAMRIFFAEIKGLVNAAFNTLFEEVQGVPGKDPAWRTSAMSRGLAFMSDRRNEKCIIESVVDSEEACRSLTRQYFAAMYTFVRDAGTHKRDMLTVNFIPFGTFIARLYRKLSTVREMKERYYTTMSYAEKDAMLRDVLRQVMHSAVIWPLPTTQGPSFEIPIKPSDSVSNIYVSRGGVPEMPGFCGTVVGQSVARSIISTVTPDAPQSKIFDGIPSNEETPANGLPDAARAENNTPADDGRSRFTTFGTASVIGSAPKVVTVGLTDK